MTQCIELLAIQEIHNSISVRYYNIVFLCYTVTNRWVSYRIYDQKATDFYILGKRRIFFGRVGLFVSNISKKKGMIWSNWDEILWKDLGQCNEKLINFWWRSGSSKMSKWAKTHTWPDHGAGNDPGALGLALHNQGTIHSIMHIVG